MVEKGKMMSSLRNTLIILVFGLLSCTAENSSAPSESQTDSEINEVPEVELSPQETNDEVLAQEILAELEIVLGQHELNSNPGLNIQEQNNSANQSANLNGDANPIPSEQNQIETELDIQDVEANESELDSMSTSGIEVVITTDNQPEQITDEFGRTISDEQEFTAVTQRETIESDAQRLEAIRQNLVILDSVEFDFTPNQEEVFRYALNTDHSPGTVLYERNLFFFNRRAYLERCERFVDSDAAQQYFLTYGGPEEDKHNLDPDGDGFACEWNPERYRQLLNQL